MSAAGDFETIPLSRDLGRIGSSGSLLADKRYAYAEALLAEGDAVAAADLFAQAVDHAPAWAAGHLARGLALEAAGSRDEAVEAFGRAQALDPDDRLGAGLHVARLGRAAPPTLPPAYVATLFDQYAPHFDVHLVEGLSYRGPQAIRAALDSVDLSCHFATALDLGCGTGLMAKALVDRTGAVDGIDLSTEMVKRAHATGAYRGLITGDCVTVMRNRSAGAYDLVIAADVLVYMGELRSLFSEVSRVLRRGGLFAATLQAATDGDFALGEDLRFRHSRAYLEKVLASVHLRCLHFDACSFRTEARQDVASLVFVAGGS